ncbi:MAG TPA: universal stress protein [Acidimicrobiales bacterium]|nr:universal stress protein [Acidimicrobiales bacterium]
MYRRIVVGTDGSETAGLAVKRAVEIAAATGSDLTILSVGPRDQALATAEAAARQHDGSGVSIDGRWREGDPAKALLAQAEEEGAGLLVVGSKGMTGARHVVGSVPNTVSHHAPCHLLIVHTT